MKTNRAQLFARLPETQAEAVDLLRALDAADLAWHLDEGLADTFLIASGARMFTDAECVFLRALVERLNDLWAMECDDAINAGAWMAAALAEWVPCDFDDDTRENGPR